MLTVSWLKKAEVSACKSNALILPVAIISATYWWDVWFNRQYSKPCTYGTLTRLLGRAGMKCSPKSWFLFALNKTAPLVARKYLFQYSVASRTCSVAFWVTQGKSRQVVCTCSCFKSVREWPAHASTLYCWVFVECLVIRKLPRWRIGLPFALSWMCWNYKPVVNIVLCYCYDKFRLCGELST